jgi:uncharacterized membrane protein YvbJ
MISCPECGALVNEKNSVCWRCKHKFAGLDKDTVQQCTGTNSAHREDPTTMEDWIAAFLMMAVPVVAYYIVYLKGL